MDHQFMLSTSQVKSWVSQGGGWCPFCQSEQLKYVGTSRAINGVTTVKHFCRKCQRTHFAIYSGDEPVDVTHDEIDFRID